MPTLGAIADDFTGATDLATMLVARGHRTVVTVGPESLSEGPEGTAVRDADAVVVALKSRTAPVDEAVGTSLAALRALRRAGCERFYFKYCSTFDSTPMRQHRAGHRRTPRGAGRTPHGGRARVPRHRPHRLQGPSLRPRRTPRREPDAAPPAHPDA